MTEVRDKVLKTSTSAGNVQIYSAADKFQSTSEQPTRHSELVDT